MTFVTVLRWKRTVKFNISPIVVALEPLQCKVYFLTWSFVTSIYLLCL